MVNNTGDGVVELFLEHLENNNTLDWNELSKNPAKNITTLYSKYPNQVKWHIACFNPSDEVIEFMFNNCPNRIIWENLARNTCDTAIDVMKEHTKYNNMSTKFWKNLSRNTKAIEILKDNPNKIQLYELSANMTPEASDILKDNIDYIDWSVFVKNESNQAIELIEQNLNKCNNNWYQLSQNPKALHIIRERLIHQDILEYLLLTVWIGTNPGIFI